MSGIVNTSLDMDDDFNLYEDLIVESIQNKGRNFFYLPRTFEKFDSFFGEDTAPSSFNSIAEIEMYMMNIDEWQGSQTFITTFGLDIQDSATVLVSKRRFLEEVTDLFPHIKRPMEGDILIFPSQYDRRVRAFEITFVDNESIFYFLGNLPTYKLSVRAFSYSGEKFNTGNEIIDNFDNKWSIKTLYTISNVNGQFIINEIVDSDNWSAKVISHNGTTINLAEITGTIKNGDGFVGQESMATADISSSDTLNIDSTLTVDNESELNDDSTILNIT